MTLFSTLPASLAALSQDILPEERLRPYFAGQVAAITGAGSGMGRQLAINLAKFGCHVALSDINEDHLKQTQELLTGLPIKSTLNVLDVADAKAVYAWADEVMHDHGKVNFIFNNAGVALYSSVEGMSLEELEWLMNINFWGVVYGTKAFLPLIKNTVMASANQAADDKDTKTEHGHIVNISSLFGLCAQPSQSAYNASKFAVRGFTESLRQELDMMRCGISATCVHPGGIKTNIANNARGNDSIQTLGMSDGERTIKSFNKMLRFDADQAALVILSAVVKDQRRCLIGSDAKVLDVIQRLLPTHYQPVITGITKAMKRRSDRRSDRRSRRGTKAKTS